MMNSPARPPVRRAKSVVVRSALLDAAESLFAEHGYHGVSIRDVATAAGVGLGRLTYNFGTKEELFRQVVARRAEEYVGRIDRSLGRVLADADNEPPSPEAIIRAHVSPIFDLARNHGDGWKKYLQLLARAMNDRPHQAFLEPVSTLYDPLLARIVSAFARACPNAPRERLHWGFYFLESALIHILLEAGNIDRHSDGHCRASDFERILEELVPFYAVAFRNLSVRSGG